MLNYGLGLSVKDIRDLDAVLNIAQKPCIFGDPEKAILDKFISAEMEYLYVHAHFLESFPFRTEGVYDTLIKDISEYQNNEFLNHVKSPDSSSAAGKVVGALGGDVISSYQHILLLEKEAYESIVHQSRKLSNCGHNKSLELVGTLEGRNEVCRDVFPTDRNFKTFEFLVLVRNLIDFSTIWRVGVESDYPPEELSAVAPAWIWYVCKRAGEIYPSHIPDAQAIPICVDI